MLAQILDAPDRVENDPLKLVEREPALPGDTEIRIRVSACGVCHTDLHIVEGDIKPSMLPLIPGHQIVGTVEATGERAARFKVGTRVGVPWLNWIDPRCRWFGTERENLCESIRFTGFDTHGGYAEYITIDEGYAYPLPREMTDLEIAPLLCAGVIGYRALKLSEFKQGETVGLFGFGASAHIVLQVARYWRKKVLVFTRSESHRAHAQRMGAEWVGAASDTPPCKLDSAVIFAPVGELVVRALQLMERGGTLVHAGIHSTPIPSFDYQLLYHERSIRSAANSTRRDVVELLELAPKIPIRTTVTVYPLSAANKALQDVKASRIDGAAVLEIPGAL